MAPFMADRKSMCLKLSPKDEVPSDVYVNDVTCIEPSDVECRPFYEVTCCFVFFLHHGHIVGVKLILTTFPYISKHYGEGSLGKNPNLEEDSKPSINESLIIGFLQLSGHFWWFVEILYPP